jgi:hypothetical protein
MVFDKMAQLAAIGAEGAGDVPSRRALPLAHIGL